MSIAKPRSATPIALSIAALAFAATLGAQAQSRDQITPSHVYQAAQNLISEIHVLRDAMGIMDYPPEAEPQEDRAPIHVYAKTLEVLTKIGRAQRRLGMQPVKVGQIPVKEIVASDVLSSVDTLLWELHRTKAQLVIEDEITPAPFEGGKTPSFVYKALGDASFLLDGLLGRPISPTDVYSNVVHIQEEMELIAAKLKVALELDPPVVEGRKRPQDMAQQVLRATFKTINLETRLGMDASGVPNLTLVRVTPAEVYEATNVLLAEMVRIKAPPGYQPPARRDHERTEQDSERRVRPGPSRDPQPGYPGEGCRQARLELTPPRLALPWTRTPRAGGHPLSPCIAVRWSTRPRSSRPCGAHSPTRRQEEPPKPPSSPRRRSRARLA